ncbi:hypothetical protein [Abyssibacter profundi]|uniref:Uncharacterized protein n=1 Tax=Abyssibacter profundi TaxID=2182787 RepID=A0A363ULH0_9GAMM|nr:hypothetical protein [Abyssibacter profundi]PWN56272.1 hypothetical protein DEH80_08380 [Abyssibacter profundi]
MRITQIRFEYEQEELVLHARLDWEDNAYSGEDLFVRYHGALEASALGAANAFFIAAAIPAMVFGEARLTLDQPVCPTLRRNIGTALNWLNHWFALRDQPLELEVETVEAAELQAAAVTASYFSGGVDSWATLLRNHRQYASGHPGRIRRCMSVYGLQRGITRENFDAATAVLQEVVAQLGVELLTAETNIYRHWMDRDPGFFYWTRTYNGAALAAVAQGVPSQLNRVLIASSDHMRSMEPWGTHPLLDPCFSSHDLQVEHDSIDMSRLQKTREIAGSPLALAHLRVCDVQPPPGFFNCGACEKCVRTMMMLEGLGALRGSGLFPVDRLEPSTLLRYGNMDLEFEDYLETLPLLLEQGREDLQRPIEILHRRQRELDFRGLLKRLDRRLLGGWLRRRYGHVGYLSAPAQRGR